MASKLFLITLAILDSIDFGMAEDFHRMHQLLESDKGRESDKGLETD